MLLKSSLLLLQGPASRRLMSSSAARAPLPAFTQQHMGFATRFIRPSSSTVVHIDAVKRKVGSTSSKAAAAANESGAFTIDFRLASHVQIPCTLDTPLRTISDTLIASEGNNIEKVQFFALTGSKLPLCETVGSHRSYPVLVQINDDRVFALNFTEEMQI